MIHEDLADIWADSKPQLLSRCTNVHQAAADRDADDDALAAARSDSHKLAGAVGMFGLVEASELALALDRLVDDGGLVDERRDEVAARAVELARAIEDER